MRIIRHGYQVHVRRRRKGRIVRWVLRDSRRRYWTGTEWEPCGKKALLFADKMEAQCDAAMFEYEASPRRFFTFLNVLVDPSSEFTDEELADYLRRNLQMYVTDDSGKSPLDRARIEFNIDAELIQEDRDAT
jgi:hypothetical protein